MVQFIKSPATVDVKAASGIRSALGRHSWPDSPTNGSVASIRAIYGRHRRFPTVRNGSSRRNDASEKQEQDGETALRASSRLLSGGSKQQNLFSGLLRCGECGGNITLVGGRAKTSRSECSFHAQRGDSTFYAGTTAQLDAQFFNLVNNLDKSSVAARRHNAASTDASRSFSDMCRSMTTLGSVALFYDVLSSPEKVAQWAREMSVG